MQNRAFRSRPGRLLVAVLLCVALVAACGDDDDDDDAGGATDTSAAAGEATDTTAAAGGSDTTTGGGAAESLGTVRTQFNWVPDVEWSAWYLADSKGFFASRGVEVELLPGGPNTPQVTQVLAAGSADIGVASNELEIVQANAEGADFVVLAAMYQRSPYGYCWLAENPISSVDDLVGKRIGGPQGDQLHIEAVFAVNDLDPQDYTFVPMSFDPQPLVDGEMDAITCYVTNQPVQLELQGHDAEAAPFSDFGLPSYGDLIFTTRAFLDANRDLVVAYLAALVEGVEANVANPDEVIPLLVNEYGKDAEIDEEYAPPGNAAYIELLESDFTDANGLLSIDPDKMENEVFPGLEAAGETNLPAIEDFLDTTVLADAHAMLGG
jgi:ABC-type nitrate/sulfonate/bicarbonate transport system substrate-binding protein